MSVCSYVCVSGRGRAGLCLGKLGQRSNSSASHSARRVTVQDVGGAVCAPVCTVQECVCVCVREGEREREREREGGREREGEREIVCVFKVFAYKSRLHMFGL